MEKTINSTKSSDLYRKIDALRLPYAQRQRALASARTVERLVRGIEHAISWLSFGEKAALPNAKAASHQ